MARQRAFGKTWWGNAWVEAMERIDYNTNRLPRGRSYARNGSVKAIEIKDGDVFAKVQGSRARPYDVKISLKRFKEQAIKKIKEAIAESPVSASELSLGKLPESLLPALEGQNIHLLPANWNDMAASCSCPDWANPCKHLAAVYYIIGSEIDKDPFIIFKLRGLTSEELTESAGLTTGAGGHSPLQTIIREDFFIPIAEINLSEPQTPNAKLTDLPDLSFTPLDVGAIFSLLPDNPLFYSSGDFKKEILHAYRSLLKDMENLEVKEDSDYPFSRADFCLVRKKDGYEFLISPPAFLPSDIPYKTRSIEIPVILTPSLHPSPLREEGQGEGGFRMKKTKGKDVPFIGPVFDLFLAIPIDATSGGTPSARFLNIAASVALAFVRSGSVFPEVIMHEEGFAVRYVPMVHDEKTKAAVDYLKSAMPPNICMREEDGDLMTREGIPDLLSLIITHIFHRFARFQMWSGRDKLHKAFFLGTRYKAERFEERHTAKAVSDWLERLSIRKRDISPVIKVEVKKNNFLMSVEAENRKDPLSPTIPLSKVFDAKDKVFSLPAPAVRNDLSRQIVIAGEYMPPLRTILNSRGKEKAVVPPVEMTDFLTGSVNVLSLLGINTILPKELKKLATPGLAVRAEAKGKGATTSYLSLDAMLDFSWEIAIGDEAVSKDEFLKLARSVKGIVRFRDQYVLLRPDEVKGILERLNRPLPELSSMDILRSAFTGEHEGVLFNPCEAIKKILDDIARVEETNIPAKLNAVLRAYQERGFRWLYSNTIKGFGSCIADDMGLGKTIQVIALILKLKEEGRMKRPVLVACPTTLVGNWHKECERFAPSLNVAIYHGTERSLALEGKDVIITTYGILRRDVEKFRGKEWGLAVIDEAQNIKNPDTDQTKAVKSLKATTRIAMSGTPVENRLTELWSIFDFINRGYLGNVAGFKGEYAAPIEKYKDKAKIERLRKATAPFLLRRLKTDKTIISDLPDKVIFDEYCYLSKEQAALYQQVVDNTMKEIETSEGIERKGLIFKLITSLKQICNHPAHYSKKGKPAKELSGKAEKTLDIIGKTIAAGEKALIFTQYKEMGELLAEMIREELKEIPLFFHGGISRGKRDRMVEDFQTDRAVRLMVVSLKAGGTGLNLTAASNVIHYDLWWNPAVEAQATDRAYRIGQDKNVMVHRLITLGTFEERIDEMIRAKKELADLTVSTGEQWITEMSNKELKEIFSLR